MAKNINTHSSYVQPLMLFTRTCVIYVLDGYVRYVEPFPYYSVCLDLSTYFI